MESVDIDKKKAVYRLALFMGELMLKNGAETYRIEDSVLRMCHSRGYTYTNVFVTPTVLIISDERYDGVSFMKSITLRDTDLSKVARLNSFSREFVENKDMSLSEARKKLKEIEGETEYKMNVVSVGLATGCATYSLLLGGTLNDFIFTFLVAFMTNRLYDKFYKMNNIEFFSTLITAALIALTGSLLKTIGLAGESRLIIIGGIMPLFPGVNLVKAVRDLISGNLLSGLARMFEACITATAIATGVGFALNLWEVIGGVM